MNVSSEYSTSPPAFTHSAQLSTEGPRVQQDVRNIVMNMRANGECVRYADVLRRLPASSLRSWVLVKKAYDDAVSGGVCP